MIPLPDVLKEPMRLYRECEMPLPEEFTWWHRTLADTDLRRRNPAFHTAHWTLLSDHGLVRDDFGFDGLLVRQVVVAINHGQDARDHGWGAEDWRVHTLRWHESGAWFEKGAGWTRFANILPRVTDDVRLSIPLGWTQEKIIKKMEKRAGYSFAEHGSHREGGA